jgi:YfiH family protein
LSAALLETLPCLVGHWIEPAGSAARPHPDANLRNARLRQVHGARVWQAGDVLEANAACEGDALVSDDPGVCLQVITADCVPVVLSDPDGRCVAAIHAGWRGQVGGVIGAGLESFAALVGGRSRPAEWRAYVGAHLSPARFEVGEEVAEAFASAELGACVRRDLGARPHVDLARATRLQLERAGLEHIALDERCTWESAELPSYRRDVTHGGRERTGRLVTWVRPTPARGDG